MAYRQEMHWTYSTAPGTHAGQKI